LSKADIENFPTKLPDPNQVELLGLQLSGILMELARDLQSQALELIRASDAGEFATVVRKTADTVAGASAGWVALSNKIKESWRI
jgi:hypothetical protein